MKMDVKESERYVKSLIETGENQHLDFKFEISNARKMARTFSAFANTDGGRLLIGVKDNGRISGVRSEEEAYMAESAAHIFCKPAVPFLIKKWIVEGKSILEVEVPGSHNRPHFVKDEKSEWIAYVRVGDQNIKASSILVNIWKTEGMGNHAWLNYGKEEKSLLDYLKEHDKISLSTFTRIARTNRSSAEKILINLVLMRVIDVETTEKAEFFKIRKPNN
jgi:predicted HTH transcriptional regulator